MMAAKKQWLEEKSQQVQEEVALAKVQWEKEEKEVGILDHGILNFFLLFCCLFSETELCAVILPLEVSVKDLSF